MKRGQLFGIACALVLGISGCSAGGDAGSAPKAVEERAQEGPLQSAAAIKPSPDKYTWYVKNYVGMNAASVGYTALDGMRREMYGSGNLKIVLRAEGGEYLDPSDEEQLKGYVVVAQDLAPNTELKYTFLKDSDGEEFDNLIDCQNYDEIVLAVAKVGENRGPAPQLAGIESSPDKYTRYVKDYVGRNLAACGYLSLANTFNDSYGNGYVRFDITAEDGSYVDAEDADVLAQYEVTSQSVAPNTEITMSYMTDSDGKEYGSLVETQSLESIALIVKKLEQ